MFASFYRVPYFCTMMREIMQICAGASSLCQIVERALVILIKTAPGSVTPGGHYQSDLVILPTINLTNHQSYQPYQPNLSSIIPTISIIFATMKFKIMNRVCLFLLMFQQCFIKLSVVVVKMLLSPLHWLISLIFS